MTLAILFINAFGLLFGYAYPDLLVALGIKREFAHSTLSISILALIVVVGFAVSPYLVYGQPVLVPLDEFYPTVPITEALMKPGAEMFNIAVFLVIGGMIRLAQNLILPKIKK